MPEQRSEATAGPQTQVDGRAQSQKDAESSTKDSDTDRSDSTELDRIKVVAFRQSLAEGLKAKRAATDIRDVISAADVGDFPDQNLAEAVQRLPGVAITRSKGEGRFVTIRGLPPELNRVAWNGITLPSSEDDRAVPLDILSADLFGSIAVVKSQSADKDEGAVGGSINLMTPSPLALPDNTISLTTKGFYNSLAQDAGPAASALAAKKFFDGTVGAVAGVTYSDRTIRQDSIESGGWNFVGDFFPTGDARTDELLVWENGKPTLFEEDRERLTGLLGLEGDFGRLGRYRFDAMFSSFKVDSKRFQLLHRFKNADAITNIVDDGAKVVSADVINAPVGLNNQLIPEDTDSLLTSLRADWKLTPAWSADAQIGFLRIESERFREVYKFRPDGFNIGYDVSERFNPEFRYNNFSFEEIVNSPELFEEFDEFVLNPRDSEDETLRFEANTRYKFSSSIISSVIAGAQYQERTKESIESQIKGDSNTQPLTDFREGGIALPGNDDFIDGRQPWFGNVLAPFDNLREGIFPNGFVDVPPDLLDSFNVEEEVTSLYLRADYAIGSRVTGNIGNRVVITDFTSNGFENINGNIAPVSFGDDYVQNLPSGTMNIALRDDLVLRGSGGRAMVKPQFPDLAPRRGVNEEELAITQGNPDLDPFLATQGDLSLEWYFSGEGLLAVAGLYKDIESFIFDQTRVERLSNPEDFGASPELAGEQFSIRQPLNGNGAEVWGLEFVWQQPFDFLPSPFEGFGIQSNYTYLDSNADFSANIVGEDQSAGEEGFAGQSFGLPGISDHVINTTLYYEAHGLTVRLSYNYRTEFLISPAGSEGQPEFIDDFDQIDAFLGYDITPKITVFAEGINLNNEPLRRFSQPGNKIELYSDNGYRIFAGVRAKF